MAAAGPGRVIPQVAPGRYEVKFEAPGRGMLAAVGLVEDGRQDDARVIDRAVIPGRYAPEFERLGNDYGSMRELARRSGGDVIDSLHSGPIAIDWPRRLVDLSAWLAGLGAVMLALGLARWRWG
jgi:hypothetical protein